MTTGRTIVIAPSLDDAKQWCQEHHIAPHGRATRLRSTPDAVRGLSFAPGDWLVVLRGTSWATIDALHPALWTAPSGDIVEALVAWRSDVFGTDHFEHVFCGVKA